jgi:hypothetical protein
VPEADTVTHLTDGGHRHESRYLTQDLYDEAKNDGWIVISMKNDIFAFDSAP